MLEKSGTSFRFDLIYFDSFYVFAIPCITYQSTPRKKVLFIPTKGRVLTTLHYTTLRPSLFLPMHPGLLPHKSAEQQEGYQSTSGAEERKVSPALPTKTLSPKPPMSLKKPCYRHADADAMDIVNRKEEKSMFVLLIVC